MNSKSSVITVWVATGEKKQGQVHYVMLKYDGAYHVTFPLFRSPKYVH